MKKQTIGALSVFLVLALWTATAAAAAPQPRAVVPEHRIAFGTVVEGDTVVREFAVKNEGDAPLVIEKVNTG